MIITIDVSNDECMCCVVGTLAPTADNIKPVIPNAGGLYRFDHHLQCTKWAKDVRNYYCVVVEYRERRRVVVGRGRRDEKGKR